MAHGFSTDVLVTRRVRDGWYCYTCDELPGLLVASQDDRKAFRDVPASIRALFQLEYGLECAVTQKVGYSEFVQWVALFERASVSDLSEKPLGEALEYISFTLYPVSEREQDGHV